MASVTATPNPARVGQSVSLLGDGFAASTATAVRLDSEGFAAEITSDAGGLVSNDDINDHADGTLTNTGNPAAADTVVIGSVTYTFRATLTAGGLPNEVLIGGTASVSFDNLKAAINGAAGAGTTYGAGTVAHPDVIAGAKTATTLVVVARLAGTAGNSIASTEGSTVLSWGAGTLLGGLGDPTGFKQVDWVPTKPGTFTVIMNDGTNSASAKVQVFLSA